MESELEREYWAARDAFKNNGGNTEDFVFTHDAERAYWATREAHK